MIKDDWIHIEVCLPIHYAYMVMLSEITDDILSQIHEPCLANRDFGEPIRPRWACHHENTPYNFDPLKPTFI